MEEKKCEKYQYVSLSKAALSKGQVISLVLSWISGNRMFFHILSTKEGENSRETHSQALNKMYADMEQFYESNCDNGDIFIDCPRVGQPCAILWKNGDQMSTSKYGILRGIITEVKPGKPELCDNVQVDAPNVTVFAVDEGKEQVLPLSKIRYLPPKFMRIPKLAIQAHLSGIEMITKDDGQLGYEVCIFLWLSF